MNGRPRLATLALFLILLYFTFVGGSIYTDFNFGLRALHQLITTLLLGAWLVRLLIRREPWPRTALDWPIAAWLAVNLITGLAGLSPRYSLEKTWNAVVLVLAFYLLVDLKRRGWLSNLVRGWYLCAAVVCLIGLVEWLCWYFGIPLVPQFQQGWPQATGWTAWAPPYAWRISLPMNHPTPLAAYLAVLIPSALALALTLPDRESRRALWVWLALALPTEFLTYTRGGWLAVATSLAIFGLASLLGRSGTGARQWLRAKRWRPPALAVTVIGLLIASALVFMRLLT